jgi:hypothetical protein
MLREIKFFFQRRTRGWDDSDLWNLDVSLAKVILPRLKAFAANHAGYPGSLTEGKGEEEWQSMLDRMVAGFDFIANSKMWSDFENIEEGMAAEKEAYEAVELFGKWFGGLWD